MRLIRNPRLSRRGALASMGRTALGVAGLAYPGPPGTLISHARPVTALSATEPASDPGFTGGTVQVKTADTLVISNPAYTRIVRIPPGATIWKEFHVSIDEVQIGDRLLARGEPQEDGSLLARPGWVWINIAPWHGSIMALRLNGLLTRRHDGREREIVFSSRLEVISG